MPRSFAAAAFSAVEHGVHLVGVAGLPGLVVHVLGDDAVLAHDVAEHIPLAAVVHAGGEDVHDRAVVGGQAGGQNDALEEVVAALKLVPEGEVALRKLEFFQIVLLGDALAEHVRRGEQPAAAAALLIADLHRRNFDGELLPHGVGAAGDEGDAV